MKSSDESKRREWHLDARKFWDRVLEKWELHPGERRILASACESLTDLRKAEALVESEGLVVTDRFGQKKTHPAVLTAEHARALMLRSLRQLGLKDEEAIKERRRPGRPERVYPGQRSR